MTTAVPILLMLVLAGCDGRDQRTCDQLHRIVADESLRALIIQAATDQLKGGQLEPDKRVRGQIRFPGSRHNAPVDPRLARLGLGSRLEELVLGDGKVGVAGVFLGVREWEGIVVDLRSDRRVPLVVGLEPPDSQLGVMCYGRD